LKPQLSDVRSVIEEVVGNFSPQFSVKQITVQTDIQAAINGGDLSWRMDRLSILRVLSNLLSNAIKFTPKGGSVVISSKKVGEELHLSVSDTGTGMESSEVKQLFQRYCRLEQHSHIAGTGLGLFVVKSIVAAHGGRVEVVSQKGKGTRFEVVLPENPPINERGELISLDFA